MPDDRKASIGTEAVVFFKELSLRVSLRNIGWLFSVLVMGCYVFTVEAALFIPSSPWLGIRWYEFTNVLMPVRVAGFAWGLLSVLAVFIGVRKKPISLAELLTGFVFLIVSLPSAYALAVGTLGGGLYWSLADKLDLLTQRVPIGLAFLIGWAYVFASPLLKVEHTERFSAHFFLETAPKIQRVVVDWQRQVAYYCDERVDRAVTRGRIRAVLVATLDQDDWTDKQKLTLIRRGPTPKEMPL